MVHTTATIEAGSFSRLSVYEECPRRAQYAFCQKIPEPDRGEPHARCPMNPETKKREWHNDRGTRIHESMDDYIRGITDKYCIELRPLAVEITNARASYEEGLVHAEDMWCFKDDWTPTHNRDWNNIWMRIKLDVFNVLEGTLEEPLEASTIDLKSGKIFGNEVKHAEQLQLYAVGSFKKYPSLEKAHTELWYCDQNEVKVLTYTRKQALKFQKRWDNRMDKMCSDTVFKARPSQEACRYCPYRTEEDKGSGHCDVAFSYTKSKVPPKRAPTKGRKKTARKAGSRSRAG